MKTKKINICVLMALLLMATSCKRLFKGTWPKYETFNEYTMKGEGVAKKAPYVRVYSSGNKIIVALMGNYTKQRSYTYHAKGKYWSSVMKNPEDEKMTTVYRFFYNDTIIEQEVTRLAVATENESYIIWYTQIYLKTKHNCVIITPGANEDLNNDNRFFKLREICRNYKKQRVNLAESNRSQSEGNIEEGYLNFDKTISRDSLYYRCMTKTGPLIVKFRTGPLGEWITEPAFGEERYLDDIYSPVRSSINKA